jgi:hypothetical protein
MFKGFRWYDWLIGLFTYGAWIVFKVLKNNGWLTLKTLKVVAVFFVILVGASFVFVNSDLGKAVELESALKNNNLADAERILSERPDIKSESGLTAAEVVAKIKLNLEQAEAERIAKEKAEAEARAEAERTAKAEQLSLAKRKGYDTYELYLAAEAERIAKEKAEAVARAEAERIAKEKAEAVARAKAERITQCKSDWSKCRDNSGLVNNYDGITSAKVSCKYAANKHAQYGDPDWNWIIFGQFYKGKSYIETGRVLLIEDDVKFQNGFGAMKRTKVTCIYDLKSKQVLSVDVK